MSIHDCMLLFALNGSRDFGQRVADILGVPLTAHEEREFEDGEHKARPLESVRGADVFVIHSLHADGERSSNDRLCRLLFFIGAVKDAGADRVTAVVPYLCYARKDRKTKSRDPVTTRYVAALFEAVGVDRVLTMDVHNLAAYQNAFRVGTDHLEARPLFAAYLLGGAASGSKGPRAIAGRAAAEGGAAAPDAAVLDAAVLDDVALEGGLVVVSPDAGGEKRADALRVSLEAALGRTVGRALMEKKRSAGVVSGELLVGDVADATVIVVDDLVSTGTTLARAARACRERGARHVVACATHGLFVGDAAAAVSAPALDRLVVTNTVPPFRLPAEVVRRHVTVLDVAPRFAQAIAAIHDDGSIVALQE